MKNENIRSSLSQHRERRIIVLVTFNFILGIIKQEYEHTHVMVQRPVVGLA